MKYILLTLLLSTSVMFAQQDADITDSLKKELETLKEKHKNLNGNFWWQKSVTDNGMETLSADFKEQSATLEALVNQKDSLLQEKVTVLYNNLEKNAASVQANNEKINTEQAKAEKNFLYTIVGILVVLVLVIVIYLLTQRRANSIEQKTGDLDASTEALKKQLSDLSTSTSEDIASALEKFASISGTHGTETAPDHTMVKEFAKQIVSMENNMSRMDANDRGLKRIKRAIDKMHDTLKTMDYEITRLLGTNVFEGQNIDLDKQDIDEDLNPGIKKIHNIVKAEILYNGKQIQRGKVDIKYNPND
ncbi:hypothetical protein N9W09_03120 [Crocinitomicaceae bacterium]|nr:hypothetical protein [Crocinitomicaceae bacterium]